MFSDSQLAALRQKTGLADARPLVAAVRACGFDEGAYLRDNPGLAEALGDPAAGFLHFLEHGFAERRAIACGPLPDGLAALASLDIPERRYATLLFRAVFFGQLRHPRTEERLWAGLPSGTIGLLRAMGGVPYYVFGDSHVSHFVHRPSADKRWLAPLPVICHAGSALGLGSETSRLQYGPRILNWARAGSRAAGGFDVPVFLKFGGIDAEFLWMMQRLKQGIVRFSVEEYDGFARRSVAAYGGFLDALATILGRQPIRVHAVFPTALRDDDWIERFVQAHRGTPASDRQLYEKLGRMEIPDLPLRTQLRALYNAHLAQRCRENGLIFVDDFSIFLDATGSTAERYRAGPDDHHLPFKESEEALINLIWDFVGPRPGKSRAAA